MPSDVSQRWAPTGLAAVLIAVAGLATIGCGEEISPVNQPAQVTSVGPVVPHDWGVYIQYSLRDLEADDQSINIEICEADNADADTCPTPVAGAGGDGTTSLPTVPADTDVSHRFSWNVGCGRVDGDSCVESDLDQTYVARISLESADDAEPLRSEPFTLQDVGLEEMPDCDPSGSSLPAACRPDDG